MVENARSRWRLTSQSATTIVAGVFPPAIILIGESDPALRPVPRYGAPFYRPFGDPTAWLPLFA
jgi:hypothetical protein